MHCGFQQASGTNYEWKVRWRCRVSTFIHNDYIVKQIPAVVANPTNTAEAGAVPSHNGLRLERINASLHRDQNRRNIIQKSLSVTAR
jgi:hypothetical protein